MYLCVVLWCVCCVWLGLQVTLRHPSIKVQKGNITADIVNALITIAVTLIITITVIGLAVWLVRKNLISDLDPKHWVWVRTDDGHDFVPHTIGVSRRHSHHHHHHSHTDIPSGMDQNNHEISAVLSCSFQSITDHEDPESSAYYSETSTSSSDSNDDGPLEKRKAELNRLYWIQVIDCWWGITDWLYTLNRFGIKPWKSHISRRTILFIFISIFVSLSLYSFITCFYHLYYRSH